MRRALLLLTATAALTGATLLGLPERAPCTHCVPTFCGASSECPGNCVCAIEQGDATGHCVGTR